MDHKYELDLVYDAGEESPHEDEDVPEKLEEKAPDSDSSSEESDEASEDDERSEGEESDAERAKPPLPSGYRKMMIVRGAGRVTSNNLTVAEATAAIATRAQEIANDPSLYTDGGGLTCPIEIAKKEFFARKSPLIVRRFVGYVGGVECVEEWPIRLMGLPDV